MLNKDEALALCRAEHGDPFAVLGLHEDAAGRLWLRALQPGADAVFAIDADTGRILAELVGVNLPDTIPVTARCADLEFGRNDQFFGHMVPCNPGFYPTRSRISHIGSVKLPRHSL